MPFFFHFHPSIEEVQQHITAIICYSIYTTKIRMKMNIKHLICFHSTKSRYYWSTETNNKLILLKGHMRDCPKVYFLSKYPVQFLVNTSYNSRKRLKTFLKVVDKNQSFCPNRLWYECNFHHSILEPKPPSQLMAWICRKVKEYMSKRHLSQSNRISFLNRLSQKNKQTKVASHSQKKRHGKNKMIKVK